MSLSASACGAASEVSSTGPDSLNLFDPTAATVETELETDSGAASSLTTTPADDEPVSTELGIETSVSTIPATTDDGSTATTAPSTTATTVTTAPAVDPNADFCQAATAIQTLGTSVDFDDAEATALFFNTQADLWGNAAAVAPAGITSDTQTVATFFGDFRDLLAANDFDLFAVFEDVNELQVSSGSDLAQIRAEQFVYANCDITPPLPEQATAAFYGGLLDDVDDRTYLAELLASAEVFTLEGAQCFVDRATADVMHPLVSAPATPAQEAALSSLLSTCQLSTGL